MAPERTAARAGKEQHLTLGTRTKRGGTAESAPPEHRALSRRGATDRWMQLKQFSEVSATSHLLSHLLFALCLAAAARTAL